jgi:hypothetical protein
VKFDMGEVPGKTKLRKKFKWSIVLYGSTRPNRPAGFDPPERPHRQLGATILQNLADEKLPRASSIRNGSVTAGMVTGMAGCTRKTEFGCQI